MRRYAEYRDSELPWVLNIPEHWKTIRVDRLFRQRKEEPLPYDEVVTAFIDGTVTLRKNVKESGLKNAFSETGWKRVLPGDVAISGMNAHLGGIGVSDSAGKCSPIYLILVPESGTNAAYFAQALRLCASSGFLQSQIQTIRFNSADLKSADLKNLYVPLPPREEQDAIVAFLDGRLAKIDRFIANKERLIALLKEQKAAIINRTVTRGLDANAPMKPSGIEWVGEIPAHWDIERLKWFVKFVTSGSRGWGDYYSDTGPIFLRIGNLSSENISLKLDNLQHVGLPAGAEGTRTRVLKDDVLVSITALIGAVGVVATQFEEAYVNQHIALVRLRAGSVASKWVACCLHSIVGKQQFNTLMYGGTKDGLSLDDVRNIRLLLPPFDEQERIVTYLDDTLHKFSHAVSKAEREIELIKEYRTALIADAVTGKIDVRAAVAERVQEEVAV